MSVADAMNDAPKWAAQSGDAWARRWRETDRGLSGLATKLDAALVNAAPEGPFRAFDVGCGPGSTSEQLARARPDAAIVACDLSPALAELARRRLSPLPGIRVVLGDAETVAVATGPFDLIYSRHGVMFFDDPVRAFCSFRSAAREGGMLVFSCFQNWEANSWASELASTAAGRPLPPPGREPGAFAFAEPDYVAEILQSAGWSSLDVQAAPFTYTVEGDTDPVAKALDFLSEIGPASRVLSALPQQERRDAQRRMQDVIERHRNGPSVDFPAAGWIWSAKAAGGTQ